MNRHTKCRCSFLVLLMLAALSSAAQTDRRPQREIDGLAGPVRSVSTREEKAPIKLERLDGFGVPLPGGCLECEYDKDGHRTKSGQILNSQFHGHSTRFLRDATGIVIEAIEENQNGERTHRKLIGPFGPLEEQFFWAGGWRTTMINRYDQRGNLVEWTAFNPDGTVSSSMNATFDEAGMVTEQWLRGPNHTFRHHIVHTYDRRTKFETYTSFQEDGSAGLIFVVQDDSKVLSYWQSPGAKPGLGSMFFMDTGPKRREFRSYNSDGTFERVEHSFLDAPKRHLSRVEFFDTANQLKGAADYQYEFDHFGNWLKRTVRVWTPKLGRWELYETDYRTLIYW